MGTEHLPRNKQGRLAKASLGLTKTPRALFRYLRRMPFEGMNRHFGVTNTATTCTRCLKRMPGCEGFWLSSDIILINAADQN